MVELLHLEPGKHLLEPCAGSGLFIDRVLLCQPDTRIDAYEMNLLAIQDLQNKYDKSQQVNIIQADTLLDADLHFKSKMGGIYDFIIANPPYGAWQDYNKRILLKKLYQGIYVKETYTLFLYQALYLLKPGGRLVFIVPDTFLSLHMHKALRKHLFSDGCIEEISLFPSSFFPGVNFGYSNLCIISIRRTLSKEETANNEFIVKKGFSTVSELQNPAAKVSQRLVPQKSLLDNTDHSLFITSEPQDAEIITSSIMRISDIASCVTGFYSGNDKEFLRVLSRNVRNSKNYRSVDQNAIYSGSLLSLDGISDLQHFIPIVKGGAVRFYKPDQWFMDWSAKAVKHYKSNKKARFQNSEFYFKEGIALPMVSSLNVTASLLNGRLFDQSIVGIFPHESRFLYYLLAFFNTDICTKLLRAINPSANNSANYVKKLPFVMPSESELDQINHLVSAILQDVHKHNLFQEKMRLDLNKLFVKIYSNQDRLANNCESLHHTMTEYCVKHIEFPVVARETKRVNVAF
jgi:hypothetical protein